MACHLKECIFDYGPFPAFWCFTFERYNGTMEGMSLSWLGPEKQMFSKFNNLQYISDTLECTGRGCDSDFFYVASVCVRQFRPTDIHSSVEQTATEGIAILNQTSYNACPVSILDCTIKSYYKLVNPLVKKCLDNTGFNNLKKCIIVYTPHKNMTFNHLVFT